MFGNRVRTKEINGKTFQIHLLSASNGIIIAQKLSSIVATMMGSTSSDEIDIDFSKIATALSTNISEKELLEILGKLLKDMAIDQKAVNFDEYFSGNYGELISVITFALQENFGSFFEGMAIPD